MKSAWFVLKFSIYWCVFDHHFFTHGPLCPASISKFSIPQHLYKMNRMSIARSDVCQSNENWQGCKLHMCIMKWM